VQRDVADAIGLHNTAWHTGPGEHLTPAEFDGWLTNNPLYAMDEHDRTTSVVLLGATGAAAGGAATKAAAMGVHALREHAATGAVTLRGAYSAARLPGNIGLIASGAIMAALVGEDLLSRP
jgi:hypothetical protein